MLSRLIHNLTDFVIGQFGVLSEEFVSEMMDRLADEIERRLAMRYEFRYVLVDPQTWQLESRRLYSQLAEAQKDAGTICRVGILLVERTA